LVSSLRSWDPVTPTVRLRRPDWTDAVATVLPLERARVHAAAVWMHRPVDLVAAIERRGWPPSLRASVELYLHDDVLADNSGAWRLTVADGGGTMTPTGSEPSL